VSDDAKAVTAHAFFRPEDIAPMVLDAVRRNRPFVFDHPEQRALFRSTYAAVVEACYDDADRWHADNGTPAANPQGAVLADEQESGPLEAPRPPGR